MTSSRQCGKSTGVWAFVPALSTEDCGGPGRLSQRQLTRQYGQHDANLVLGGEQVGFRRVRPGYQPALVLIEAVT